MARIHSLRAEEKEAEVSQNKVRCVVIDICH